MTEHTVDTTEHLTNMVASWRHN